MSADLVAVACKETLLADHRLANTPGQPNGAHRFIRRTPVRPRYTADRHGKTRQAFLLGSSHHGLDHLAADRPHLLEQLGRHIQLLGLLAIGIGDETGLEPGRTPGNSGNRLGNPAARAGLGRGDVGIEQLQAPAQLSGQFGNVVHGALLIPHN
ncbi:hypothetical protein D3C76_1143840 [compost metagenome]